jgi:hypothetical protein
MHRHRIMQELEQGSPMNLTLAQLGPIVCSAFAAAAMVRLGASKKMLAIRRPHRCAACGLEQRDCRCAS